MLSPIANLPMLFGRGPEKKNFDQFWDPWGPPFGHNGRITGEKRVFLKLFIFFLTLCRYAPKIWWHQSPICQCFLVGDPERKILTKFGTPGVRRLVITGEKHVFLKLFIFFRILVHLKFVITNRQSANAFW